MSDLTYLASKLYWRALDIEPRLRTMERMVEIQVKYIRSEDTFCASCYWEGVLKPLLAPLVGWSRGEILPEAGTPDPGMQHVSEIKMPEVMPAITDQEEWLRSVQAYDVVSDHLLAMLHAADPGNGHGFECA